MSSRTVTRAAWIASLAWGFSAALAQEPPTTQPDGPRLELSASTWDFGTVWQGLPKPSTTVTVKNAGTAPLEIGDVESSCGCTVATKPKSPLAPGESTQMTVTYDSVKRRGPARQTITLLTNDPHNPRVPFQVRGAVRPLFEAKPIEELAFGRVFEDSVETRSIEIKNLYTEKMVLKLAPGQDFGSFDVELRELEPGQRYELQARTRPPLTLGIPDAHIKLTTSLERFPTFDIVAFATVLPPIAVDRKQLFLPRQSQNEIRQVLKLSYAPGQPVKLKEVRATHPAIAVELGELETGDAVQPTQTLVVILPPGDQVALTDVLAVEILTDATRPEYQKLTVPIRLIGSNPPK